MVDPVDKARLDALSRRIDSAKGSVKPGPKIEEHHSRAHLAWRMVIELVAGLGIGFGIGYGLDVLFGTLPVFLVLFILSGFVAGVRTMLRTAQEVQRQEAGQPPHEDGN